MLGQPRKYGYLWPAEVLALLSSSSRCCPVSLHYCPVSSCYCPVFSCYCPVPVTTVQFPPATVQSPPATVQFLALLSSFLALLSSFLALLSSFLLLLSSLLLLLSSFSRYCPDSSSYCPVFIFLLVSRKQGTFLCFCFRQTIHTSIPVYLFFQINTFFPIFWAHTHHARLDILALLWLQHL